MTMVTFCDTDRRPVAGAERKGGGTSGRCDWVVDYRCFKESGHSPKSIWIILSECGGEEQNGDGEQMI